jgi:hypothetical protein
MTDQERIEALEAQLAEMKAEQTKSAPAAEPQPAAPATPSGVSKDLGSAIRDELVSEAERRRELAAALALLAKRQGYKDIAQTAQALADA